MGFKEDIMQWSETSFAKGLIFVLFAAVILFALSSSQYCDMKISKVVEQCRLHTSETTWWENKTDG